MTEAESKVWNQIQSSAIVGLTEAQVAKLVDAVNTKEHPVFVGNINAPRQIVIAGSNEGMEQVLEKLVHGELAKQNGWMYWFLPTVLCCSLLPTLFATSFSRSP